MADTIRTETAALALLPTGAGPLVSAQDLRDAVYSLFRKAYFSTAITLPALADTAVPTPAVGSVALYYSTTQSALAFKVATTGTVHVIDETP
jgi:hypothetical protein